VAALITCPDCEGAQMSRTSRQPCGTCKGAGKVAEGHPALEVARARAAAEASALAPDAPTKPRPDEPQPAPPPPPLQPSPAPPAPEGQEALLRALLRAQTSAPELVTTGKKDDRYEYATEADYQAAMRGVLLREGLVLTTERVEVAPAEEVPQRSGPPVPSRRTLRLVVRISHVEGAHLLVESAGTGTDTEGGTTAGDKAVSKALTAAWKALWQHLFWYRRDGDVSAEVALRARIGEIVPAAMAEAWMVLVMGWPDLSVLVGSPDRIDPLLEMLRKRAPEIRSWADGQRRKPQ
jgi:hypothetical protein